MLAFIGSNALDHTVGHFSSWASCIANEIANISGEGAVFSLSFLFIQYGFNNSVD
jgi:hypothetical protein